MVTITKIKIKDQCQTELQNYFDKRGSCTKLCHEMRVIDQQNDDKENKKIVYGTGKQKIENIIQGNNNEDRKGYKILNERRTNEPP